MFIIKKIMFIIKKIIIFFTNSTICVISLIIPKDEKIIVIGSWFGQRFADNSKFFYLNLHARKKELGFTHIVWVTRSNKIYEELKEAGMEVHKVWSMKSIWFHLRAKFHIIDQSCMDVNSFFSVRAIRINLWHGFPLKKVGNFAKDMKVNKKNFLFYRGFWERQYVLATSEFAAEIQGKAFDVEKKDVIISGYPRNYNLYTESKCEYTLKREQMFLEIIQNFKKQGKTIIGYFPTFRDKKETLFMGLDNIDDINEIFECFEKKNIVIVAKMHFASSNSQFDSKNSNFINLPAYIDLYSVVNDIDILMTDYSSIMFDYLLTGKPMAFCPYDLEYYSTEDRGLIFDYNDYAMGTKFYNKEQIINYFSQDMEKINQDYINEYFENSKKLKEKIYGDYLNYDINHIIHKIKKISER